MDTREFLAALFAAAPRGSRIEIRAPGNFHLFTDPNDAQLRDDMFDPPKDVYFSVCLRQPKGAIEGATMVWCDVDGDRPDRWMPEPTLTASSGKGVHAYWALDRVVLPSDAVRLTKLATLAFKGDPKVCEPGRVMRLIGTWNAKYKPARLAEVTSVADVQYDPDALEELLVAAAMTTYWEGGNRHALALALSALLCRSAWPIERTERCVRAVMGFAGDDDEKDRVAAVYGTYQRVESGEFVSSIDLKEAMEQKDYRRFVDALGVTARDGDILLDGEKIGTETTIQRDLADYIVFSRDWASDEGTLARWDGTVWQRALSETLVSTIFGILCRLRVVKQAVEQEYQPTAALSKAVRDVVIGQLMLTDLGPAETHYLPVQNGVLDLRRRTLLPHSRDLKSRWVLPVEYDPAAQAPVWDAFLAEAAPGEGEFLQEWVGYCLRSGNPYQRMLWLFGPSGTGKSTFVTTCAELLGPAAVSVKSGQLDDYSVAGLARARVAVCSELSTRLLKTASLKALVASDPVVGRHPYGRPFNVVFDGKFIWASNSLPPVDQAEGLFRRIVVVPFLAVPAAKNEMIQNEIRGELSGVLNWALDGLERVDGYLATKASWLLPKSAIDTVEEYREAADTFAAFARDELIPDPEGVIAAREIYRRYAGWAKDRGYTPEPLGPVFWRELRAAGLHPEPTPRLLNGRQTRVWTGAHLAPEVFG